MCASNNSFFQVLLDDSAEGMIVTDQNGFVIYINNSAQLLLNFDQESQYNICSLLPMVKTNTSLNIQWHDRVLSVVTKELKLNGEVNILWYVADITEQNQHEKELLILNTIIDSVNEGITVTNSEGIVTIYNSPASDMEGLPPNQVVGKHINEIYNFDDVSVFLQVLATKKPIKDTYFTYTTKTGKDIQCVGNMCPVLRNGELIAVFSVFRNISRTKYLWQKTIELQEKLLTNEIHKNNGTRFTFNDIIGISSSLNEVIHQARKAAHSLSPVLIYGETGTGKELFAQSIHNESSNRDSPFLAINCAAIPEPLLESILFGTMKGAFTGAQDSKGLFEQSGSGTLFLDEINSMSINLQAKLLRVLQEKSVRRVGASSEIAVNCRIISSTNAIPTKCINDGILRADLYYRLAVICINIPPLRERFEDVKILADYFLKKFARLYGITDIKMADQFQQMLIHYSWPGNVRELEHTLESSITMIENQEELTIQHLPLHLRAKFVKSNFVNSVLYAPQNTLAEILVDVEREVLLRSLQNHHWNISQTAKSIGIRRSNLQYRMKRLQIKRANNTSSEFNS